MPYYASSQDWLRQSALLLEARPSTTRITTKYHLTDKTGSSKQRHKRRQQALEEAKKSQQQESSSSTASTTTTTTSTPAPPRASLTLKTYDPCSGACLKYRTTKAAEVSRLILSLGQLGRKMAALPADTTDVVMADTEEVGTPGAEKANETGGAPAAAAGAAAKGQAQTTQGQGQGQVGGGGGKGKKKRGKK